MLDAKEQTDADRFECARCGSNIPDGDDPILCAVCAKDDEHQTTFRGGHVYGPPDYYTRRNDV